MLSSYHRAMKESRREPRREFVVACMSCGEVIGLRFGGERVPDALHVCPEEEGRPVEEPDGPVAQRPHRR